MSKKTNLKSWFVMAVIFLGFGCTIAAGEVIYVDVDASTGGDGTTWGTAYKYLQDALHKPPTGGDEIWVAEGTYYPDEDEGGNVDPNDRTETFQLINGVAIYGGFAGTESSLGERDWETNVTTLSGDLNGDDVGFSNNGENSLHVSCGSGCDATAILDGFTITDGNANGSGAPDPNDCGGGMYNTSSSPTVANCTFSGNSALCGGGMWNGDSSSLTVTNCTFSGNSATWGGGMRNLYSSSLTVTNCTFSGNSANFGGGMDNIYSSPTVTNCTFSGNLASVSGGGMFNGFSGPTLTNCTFSGNSAGSSGGGMFNGLTGPTVTNCILWGDSASSGPEIYNHNSTPTVTYSDVEGGYGGTGNIDADPLFVDPNGPDDIVGTNDDNLRLSAGSPCIDAGDNTAVPGGVTTDLDGKPRFVDDPATTDTGNGTPPIIDLGAYEYGRSIFVDVDAPGANDGTSWADAFNYLQDALAVAGTDDQIWVAEGTYKPDANTANPDGTGDREATFQLITGVAIYGGYAGYWATDPYAEDVELYETILSGDINTPGDSSDNSYHVVTGSGTDANAVLDGFTITGGNAPYAGGGMYNDTGSPTVTNCVFRANSAYYYGSGMYNAESSPTVTNCSFTGNSGECGGGGGMCNTNSSPTVTNCTFSGNSAPGIFISEGGGGGMYNCDYSSPTVTNCVFSGNSAGRGGGGMSNYYDSSPTLTNCTFTGNSAPVGGGIENAHESSPILTNCILWGDTPDEILDGPPVVTYCDVEGGWPGEGNINANPLFIDANGLDGIPDTADDEEYIVHLSPTGSPCINAGDPGGDYSGQVDIDNQPRVAYGRVDMGADEVYPIFGDSEPDGDVDFYDFGYFANNWLLGVE